MGAPVDIDGTSNDSRPYGITSGQINDLDQDDLVVSFSGDGDFDTDRVDVVAVHRSARKVSILSHYEDGRFMAYRGCSTGIEPTAVAFANLDGDALPDMLVANRGDTAVAVSLADPDALAQRYGVGCFGSFGIGPEIFSVGSPPVPSLGNSSWSVGIAKARGVSICVLLLSHIGFASTTPCTMQIGPVFHFPSMVSDGTGSGSVNIPIPNNPAIAGLDFYGQWAVFDNLGGFLGGFSLSDSMRFRTGN